jgi:SAM-dependent methyltransferase
MGNNDKHKYFGIRRDDPDLEAFQSYARQLQRQQRSTCLVQWLEHQGHRLVESECWVGDRCEGTTLEIGVGGGQHLSYVRQRDNYFGLDLNLEYLRALRTNHNLLVVAGNILALPFAACSIDRVVAIGVLEHLYPLGPCLDEVARVMKSDAVLDVVVPPEGGFLYSVVYRHLITVPQLRAQGIQDPFLIIRFNHCNSVPQILNALKQRFEIIQHMAWPINALGLHFSIFIAIQTRKLSPNKLNCCEDA